MLGKKEFGDYQTPLEFSNKICNYLFKNKKIAPSIIIEPNCGMGNFIESSFVFKAHKYIGIDINKEYCDYCENRFKGYNVEIFNENFFDFDLKKILSKQDTVLVIGNPPWVNNSFLSSIDSKNLPHKCN
ncbi:MAG: class I SAM-dependent methyltransferase, partial [Lentisphaeria bacterium]|nr:class I SAM-dependent methyltransferase [Lentisphaeria bacterium]